MRARFLSRVRRVGNSLAVLIPVREAQEAGIREGQTVEAAIESKPPTILGFLADLKDVPFVRSREDRGRDRI